MGPGRVIAIRADAGSNKRVEIDSAPSRQPGARVTDSLSSAEPSQERAGHGRAENTIRRHASADEGDSSIVDPSGCETG